MEVPHSQVGRVWRRAGWASVKNLVGLSWVAVLLAFCLLPHFHSPVMETLSHFSSRPGRSFARLQPLLRCCVRRAG